VSLPRAIELPADGRAARAWVLVALWAATIILASSQSFSGAHTGHWLSWVTGLLFGGLPPGEFDMVHAMLRKTAHFVEYAILGALTHRAFLLTWPRRGQALRLLGSLLLVLACASLDETRQAFVPQRTGSGWDVALDFCGASFGILAYWFYARVGAGRWHRDALSLRGTVSS
jgi:VanZ family protein